MVGHWTSIRMIFVLYDLLNYECPRDLELSDTSLQVPSSTFKLGCIKYRELSLVLRVRGIAKTQTRLSDQTTGMSSTPPEIRRLGLRTGTNDQN